MRPRNQGWNIGLRTDSALDKPDFIFNASGRGSFCRHVGISPKRAQTNCPDWLVSIVAIWKLLRTCAKRSALRDAELMIRCNSQSFLQLLSSRFQRRAIGHLSQALFRCHGADCGYSRRHLRVIARRSPPDSRSVTEPDGLAE
jgi:hypothetical protein